MTSSKFYPTRQRINPVQDALPSFVESVSLRLFSQSIQNLAKELTDEQTQRLLARRDVLDCQ